MKDSPIRGIRIEPELWAELTEVAAACRMPISATMREAVRCGLPELRQRILMADRAGELATKAGAQ